MKRFRMTLHREWQIDAPDSYDEDYVWTQAVQEFLAVDLADQVDIVIEDDPNELKAEPDFVLED